MQVLALDFPPISHLIEWPPLLFKDSKYFAVNKVVILMWISVALVSFFYLTAARKKQLVPTGVQNVAESAVDFIREGIILQTMGPEGLPWTPFLLTIFSFVLVCNIWGIVPLAQMPVNARIALPAFMAIVVWVLYNVIGIAKQGFFGYFKNIMFPPGVPKPIYLLLAPIEFVSTILVRPFSLAVRLFANMLAGHLILVSFAVLATALFKATYVGAVLPGAMLVALTGFEILVAFLQAYIFTILTAVFIGGAMHPDH
ncbi:MAG: F-type H+-transporting ATPase subunit a [Actinomycetota bacterium]|nr:F-type H+-transporting ATPase subunit a [Actinomycetota bacterium]